MGLAAGLAGCGGSNETDDAGGDDGNDDSGDDDGDEDGSGDTATSAEDGSNDGGGLVLDRRINDRIPRVQFRFEYDADESRLRITHGGGDPVRPANLSIRGTGFTDADGVDTTESGPWAGAASGEAEGGPAVVAGDHVDVGVASSYEIEVLWRRSTDDPGAVLARDTGPDA